MSSHEHARALLARLRDAYRHGTNEPTLAGELTRLQEPVVVWEEGTWLFEGLISLFHSLHQALRVIDRSIGPRLPQHCLNPEQIARFFRIPAANPNRPTCSPSAVSAAFVNLEGAVASLRRSIDAIPGGTPASQPTLLVPSPDDDLRLLPDPLSTRLAARLLGVDRKTLDKLRRSGCLKWRVKNPTSSRKEYLYDKQSVMDVRSSYRVGDALPSRPPVRRKISSGYVPKHITLE
jgi:hypothetical protein